MTNLREHSHKPDLDPARFPLLALTLEVSGDQEPVGFYDPETDTWSHRHWSDQSPQKHNKEN
jgi:hypothetical protein